MLSIFKIFFALGWISFGGPAAHIGYFRNAFVEKRKWLDDQEYAQIVALSQFLPGPGSSQVGFAIGYKRGGIGGACMAFLGFTLPSIFMMLALATLSSQLTEHSLFQHVIHGLKLLAVVVVADAAWGMYKNFCQQTLTVALCIATAVALLVMPNISTQILVLLISAFIGVKYLARPNLDASSPFKPSIWPLALFVVFLAMPFVTPYLFGTIQSIALFGDFFQAGSLVFGGGHVVLPLLQNIVGDQ
ncbi:chromate efflux transporter, partial [Vibrio genomosp. F10]